MGTSDEFFNVTDLIFTNPTDGRLRLVSSPNIPDVGNPIIRNNALVLQAIFAIMSPIDRLPPFAGAIVYFPPGRYYIGRTWSAAQRAEKLGETGDRRELYGDLVVPQNVVLKFAPGAVLVPYDYSYLRSSDRENWAWEVPGRHWERYKVRIEVQGTIDAGVQQIFDVLLDNLDDPTTQGLLQSEEAALTPQDVRLHQTYYANNLRPAGQIFLTRNAIRAVYPEWWGAAPPPGASPAMEAAVVRRTTLAIQAAIDAAHTHRDIVVGIIGRPRDTPRNTTAALSPNRQVWPTLPVLFSRDYVIDRELTVGQPWWVAELTGPISDDDRRLLTYQPTNVAGALLRGVRAPNRAGAGAARISASEAHFFGDDRVDEPLTGALFIDRGVPHVRRYGMRTLEGRDLGRTDALLAVRGPVATRIEGIEFDANGTAARCLTLANPLSLANLHTTHPGAMHFTGVERCQFKNATSRLVHIGGEIYASRRTVNAGSGMPDRKPLIDSRDPQQTDTFLSTHDTTGLRFVRCTFNTLPSATSPTVGVMLYADETVDMELERCAFSGPAAPMVHAFGGRVQLDGCVLWTRDVMGTLTSPFPGTDYVAVSGGIDIFLDDPPLLLDEHGELGSIPSATCTLRNVHSRSRTLIASRTEIWRAGGVIGVLLIRVTHEPVPEPRSLEPAILWGTLATHGARLTLMGCRFTRPVGMSGEYVAPVGILLGGARSAPTFDQDLQIAERSARSSYGHVIDLGTRVQAPGRVSPPLVSVEPTVDRADVLLRGADVVAQIRALQVFEKYETRTTT